MKILIVEDDELLAQSLSEDLAKDNYIVDVVTDGKICCKQAKETEYDLIILDIKLPEVDGITVCKELRSHQCHTPIMLLTACDLVTEKVSGLNAGADDYVVKPVSIEELKARMRVLSRRQKTTSYSLKWGSLCVEPNNNQFLYQGQPLHLTRIESNLLELFLRHPHRIFTCNSISQQLWPFDTPVESLVKEQIKNLQTKLKLLAAQDLIEIVYGIGYRLQPLSNYQPTDNIFGAANSQLTNQIEQKPIQKQTCEAVASIWERYQESILKRVSVLEQTAITLQTKRLTEEQRQKAEAYAHSLAGSLGTFGFMQGSYIARQLEHLLFITVQPLDRQQILLFNQLVADLCKELEHQPKAEAPEPVPSDKRPLLLVIDDDIELAQRLVIEAQAREMRTNIAASLTAARSAIACECPDIILLDLTLADTAEDGLELLAELNTIKPTIPILVITVQDSLINRVAVAKLGGRVFLQKPLVPSQVIDTVTEVLQRNRCTEAKVLAVDDDPLVLATLCKLLEPWGVDIVTLNNPKQFWETLEETAPDLLVLDIEMPLVSGIELCQVVRNDPRWQQLPVLFLTAHHDADTVNRVFAAGADDYICKPTIGPELVTRIFNRLERSQLLRGLAETDPLTKVANRHKSILDLTRFLHLAQRQQQPLCFAILDLDHFKQVNDLYGHAVGDRVLCRFGERLRGHFRREDVVARWGGEEFIVCLYGMSKNDGARRLSQLLDNWHNEHFTDNNGSKFTVTFSAGIAQYPEDGSDLQQLYQTADAALYLAKTHGRDRIISA